MANNMKFPKISIVTPSFNQGAFLEECIDSILSQNYPNLEYIIMDGGSKDNSVDIIKKYEKYLKYWQSKPDGGQYFAINEGLSKTSGEIMSWLNSDDKYHPDALFIISSVFQENNRVEWLTGQPTTWDKEGRLVYIDPVLPVWKRKRILEINPERWIQQESTFWKRSLWNKAGANLRLDLQLASDYELWVRFSRYAELFTLNTIVGGFRSYDANRSKLYLNKYIAEAQQVSSEEEINYPSTTGLSAADNNILSVSGKIVSILKQAAGLNSDKKIFIDGVIFYLQKSGQAGISRVWTSILKELAGTSFAKNFVFLDRGYSPRIPGIKVMNIAPYNAENYQADALYLQDLMNAEGGGLFISTYFTYPENSPFMIVLHDMTPERMAMDMTRLDWISKPKAIEKACAYITISESTKRDFHKIYPQYKHKPVFLVPNAVSESFTEHSESEISQFKKKYGIRKPYFMFIGHRLEYKNAVLFFRALSLLENKEDYEIVCTGGAPQFEPQFKHLLNGIKYRVLFLPDNELSIALSGAICLVYPSLYEGFGLPILESMRSGCPVITCNNSAIPEVAADAALYVDGYDVETMKNALRDIQEPGLRERLIKAGKANAARFSWKKSSSLFKLAVEEIFNRLPEIKNNPNDPLTSAGKMIYVLSKNPNFRNVKTSINNLLNLLIESRLSLDFNDIDREERLFKSIMVPEVFSLIESVSKLDDCDQYIKYLYALILEEKGKLYEASDIYQSIIDSGAKFTRIVYLAANLALKLNKLIKAQSLLESLQKVAPKNIEINQKLAQIAQLRMKIKEEMKLVPMKLNTVELQNINKSYLDAKISIILPTKGRIDGLVELLDSLAGALPEDQYELLLYIGGEENRELTSLLKNYKVDKIFYDRDIFAAGEKFSWAKLMNHGFKNASCKWVMYASDDIVLHPLAFKTAIASLGNNGTIGGVTFLHRNTMEDYGGLFKDYGYDSAGGKTFINFGIIKKEAFLKTNGFDEGYKFYWADADICMQIWAAGFSISVSEYSLVEHNNVVDVLRTGNSEDVYFNDTRYFFEKWNGTSLFKDNNPVAKERHFLPPEGYDCVLSVLEEKNNEAPFIEQETDYSVKKHLKQETELNPKGIYEISSGNNIPAGCSNKILLTAIVSTYNSEKFIRGCIEDLIDQTLYERGGLEIVIVNSGSRENEENIICEYQKSFANIKYIKTNKRESIYKAWNRGIEAASGIYITNANTDDRHKKDAYEKMINILEEHQDYAIVYADDLQTSAPNDTFDSATEKRNLKWSDFDNDLLLFGCFIGPHPIWRKNLHDKYGCFDEKLKVVGDYEFWLRISSAAKFYHLDETLGLYFFSPDSAEHREQNLTDEENWSVRQKYLIKNLSTELDIERVEMKLKHLKNILAKPEYFTYVSDLVKRRAEAIKLEKAVSEISSNDKFPEDDSLLQKTENLIKQIKKGELIIDGDVFLSILYSIQGIYSLVNRNNAFAHESFKKSIIYDPQNPTAIQGLNGALDGRADLLLYELLLISEELLNNNILDKAEVVLYKVIELDENNLDALNNLAAIEILKNDYIAAMDIVEKVLTFDPINEVALNNLNYINQSVPANE